MLLLQTHELAAELARACVDWSKRAVIGFAGPRDQVRQATAALQIDTASARFDSDDWLYGLDLEELVVPAALSTGAVVCRAPTASEHETLYTWRLAYEVELLGAADSLESRQRSAAVVDGLIADGNVWLAIQDGVPVSLSAFTATLPDIVQLGGIYTPPELRGRGFSKVAVAGSLLAGRERGATRAVLFTSNPSAARTYEALGFRRIGDYALILLR
jgi:predicted GNAT family acetyltransferase